MHKPCELSQHLAVLKALLGQAMCKRTSSMKTMEGDFSRARENRLDTSFSDSPSHLDTRSLLLTLKKVDSASVATACKQQGQLRLHHCGEGSGAAQQLVVYSAD